MNLATSIELNANAYKAGTFYYTDGMSIMEGGPYEVCSICGGGPGSGCHGGNCGRPSSSALGKIAHEWKSYANLDTLRKGIKELIKGVKSKDSKVAKQILNEIQHAPLTKKTLYRGVTLLTKEQATKYEGKIKDLLSNKRSFIIPLGSFTSQKNIATTFAQNKAEGFDTFGGAKLAVVFEHSAGLKALDITKLGNEGQLHNYGKEKEYLVSGKFKIHSIKTTDDNGVRTLHVNIKFSKDIVK